MSDYGWDVELAQRLTKLADPDAPNRGALAHLRHGIQRPSAYVLARVGWVFRGVPDFALREAVLAAGLFAWTRGACRHTAGVNFGTAFGAGLTAGERAGRQKRFVDLLDTARGALGCKLRQALTLIARTHTGLDWSLLTRHLTQWGHPERWVQREWARCYWACADGPAVGPAPEPAAK